jgi:hypothetical protein
VFKNAAEATEALVAAARRPAKGDAAWSAEIVPFPKKTIRTLPPPEIELVDDPLGLWSLIDETIKHFNAISVGLALIQDLAHELDAAERKKP